MWENIRKFFKKETPPINEEVVQTKIEENVIEVEYGPKEGMSETHFRSQEKPPTALNENPAEAIEKDPAGISRMGEAPTTIQEQAIQNNEERIKSIIDEGNRRNEVRSYVSEETPTQKWTERHPSKRAGTSVKPPEELEVAETPEANEAAESTGSASRPPEIIEGEMPSEGTTSTGTGTTGNRIGGPPVGFGGKGLDVLDEKENFIEENDDPLSRNEEGVQNPVENLAEKDTAQEENKANRLAALFRGDNQETEKDAPSEVQDKSEDSQPGQNENEDPGYADRLAALFRGDNEEPETNNLPEISDGQKDALYLAFNESGADVEIDDSFPVDRSATLNFANDRENDDDMDMDMGGPDIGGDGGDD